MQVDRQNCWNKCGAVPMALRQINAMNPATGGEIHYGTRIQLNDHARGLGMTRGFNDSPHIWKVALWAGLGASVMVAAWPVHAQPAPNAVASGKRLAEQLCVDCHIIAPSGTAGWTDAPAFGAIANRPGLTVAGLSAIIQKPHLHMLNAERPKNEADALAAYIISLRKR
jgi:mono/diheme cytochrome c family protein